MVCGFLLLVTLTSSVWSSGSSVPLLYHVEENSNVTVEWRFCSGVVASGPSVKIHCVFLLKTQLRVFFNLDRSRDPHAEEIQHQQFVGRVQCDEDALRAGLVRLVVSRVQTNDSGQYLCRMVTGFGKKVQTFSLNITAATPEPRHETPRPQAAGRDRTFLYVGLGLAAAALAACLCTG